MVSNFAEVLKGDISGPARNCLAKLAQLFAINLLVHNAGDLMRVLDIRNDFRDTVTAKSLLFDCKIHTHYKSDKYVFPLLGLCFTGLQIDPY